ncbi:DUF6350 family protein [Microbacterium sp. HD4P20]|uniref:cell division protein PerM n=1 Tax=Microbacterium sp. HD4P20 TaxID=2864874 RepID=UPI001C641723|nr:DUF6350 family protein [Microbacterium sp. HD4P20]MCP2635276.1 DUF6350 family protein [Microbacterium sp. HD4P20]
MNRIIVALLASVDAALAVAVGLAATLAPLTLLWVFGFGGAADWGAIWPAGVTVWQFGNLVPLTVELPPEYLAATGIDGDAASFVLSLSPLAFAGFTVIFAARSGVRASRAEAWLTGVATATLVFAALATGAALTGQNTIATAPMWQAVLVPTLLFAVPALTAALVTEWREAGGGAVARLRDRVESAPHGWGDVPGVVVRGSAVVVTGLIGLGAALTAVALFARAGHVVALFEAGNVDVAGATVLTLVQLAYLPTLAIWGFAFAAGPGFAVGEGSAVSPAATQVGVVPGIPALGAVPDSTTSWLLLLALAPVALGALAGWIARSRLVHAGGIGAPATDDPIGARLVTAAGIAAISAAASALLAIAAAGAIGPGRLSTFGPDPGPLALAVALEVFLGAAILLVSPRSRAGGRTSPRPEATATDPDAPTVDARLSGLLAGGRPTDGQEQHPVAPEVPDETPAPRVDETPAPTADEARTEPIELPPRD